MTDSIPITLYEDLTEVSISGVFKLIEQVSKNLKRIQRDTIKETGLTPPQFAILQLLWDQDGRPLKGIAEALMCSRATITGIIDTLERKGLVMRVLNPSDRRSLLARLTKEGREEHKKTPSLEITYRNCCAGLTSQEYIKLGFLLRKLNNSLMSMEDM